MIFLNLRKRNGINRESTPFYYCNPNLIGDDEGVKKYNLNLPQNPDILVQWEMVSQIPKCPEKKVKTVEMKVLRFENESWKFLFYVSPVPRAN